jgi:hypothetical protein
MKLAEALLLRADILKKLASLRERILANAIVQEGDEPHEDPQKLIEESFAVLDGLESLAIKIHQANACHRVSDGRTLAEVIARRDTLAQRHSLLQQAIAGTKREPERYSMREIKWVAKVKVQSLQKQSEDLAKSLRELNAVIQETNWKAELPE